MRTKKGSNHYMYLTQHRETYRAHCLGCAKIRTLHKHPVGDYYCHQCILKINQALRKKGIDPKKLTHATDKTKDAIRDFIFWQVELLDLQERRTK